MSGKMFKGVKYNKQREGVKRLFLNYFMQQKPHSINDKKHLFVVYHLIPQFIADLWSSSVQLCHFSQIELPFMELHLPNINFVFTKIIMNCSRLQIAATEHQEIQLNQINNSGPCFLAISAPCQISFFVRLE